MLCYRADVSECEGICLAGPFLSVCFNTLPWTYFAPVTL